MNPVRNLRNSFGTLFNLIPGRVKLSQQSVTTLCCPRHRWQISNGVKGLSLLEILLAIGIIFILLLISLPLGLDFYKRQQLEQASQGILETLRMAQLKSVFQELDSSHGVFLTNENYTLFKGGSYLARDFQYDEVFNLAQIINIGGIKEVVFSKLEGKPSVKGNIEVISDNLKKIISINEIGRINLEP